MQSATSIGFRGKRKDLVAFLESYIQNPIDGFDPNDQNEVIKSNNFKHGEDDDIATVAWGCLAGFPDNDSLCYVDYGEPLDRRFELAPELEVVIYDIALEDVSDENAPYELQSWADTTPEDWYADYGRDEDCHFDQNGFTQEKHELAKSLIKHGIIFFRRF